MGRAEDRSNAAINLDTEGGSASSAVNSGEGGGSAGPQPELQEEDVGEKLSQNTARDWADAQLRDETANTVIDIFKAEIDVSDITIT